MPYNTFQLTAIRSVIQRRQSLQRILRAKGVALDGVDVISTPFRRANLPPAARKRRLRGRLAPAHLASVVLALLAGLSVFVALRAKDDTFRVLVAAAPIQPGAAVTAQSFRFENVQATGATRSSMLTPADLDDLDGWVATNAVGPGEIVFRSDLRPVTAPSGLKAMSLPVEPQHAVAGDLVAGDRIDIIAVRDSEAVFLAHGVQVLAVSSPASATGLVDVTDTLTLTVAVDELTALQLAEAISDGAIEILRSTGSSVGS